MKIFAVHEQYSTSDSDGWMYSIETRTLAHFSTKEKAEEFVKEQLQTMVDALNPDDYDSFSEYQQETFRILINERDYMIGGNGESFHTDSIYYIDEINVR